uniref:Uncharacterized protein n=1 Tax=Hyaloperonospora arabidopsidis (strain Emoy2) TaxID=559515 RepID=M4BZL7_HYAAE
MRLTWSRNNAFAVVIVDILTWPSLYLQSRQDNRLNKVLMPVCVGRDLRVEGCDEDIVLPRGNNHVFRVRPVCWRSSSYTREHLNFLANRDNSGCTDKYGVVRLVIKARWTVYGLVHRKSCATPGRRVRRSTSDHPLLCAWRAG